MAEETQDRKRIGPDDLTERPGEDRRANAQSDGTAPLTVQSSNEPHKRRDKGRLHATRHAVLSSYVLEALQALGEDVKRFRRLERRLRDELLSPGQTAAMLFDRFFSSYLHCVMAARLEAHAASSTETSTKSPTVLPSLHERDFPTLVSPNGEPIPSNIAKLPPDLLHQLLLVQRYDRHFSREMFRALSLLLNLRDGGEVGLQESMRQLLSGSKH